MCNIGECIQESSAKNLGNRVCFLDHSPIISGDQLNQKGTGVTSSGKHSGKQDKESNVKAKLKR